jgi:hypothetical protein
MSETCEQLEQAADAAAALVSHLAAQLAETEQEAAALDQLITDLLRGIAGDGYSGSWEDYGAEVEAAWNSARSALNGAEETAGAATDPGDSVDEAWAEYDRLLAEHGPLENRWLDLMAQISGDAPTDLGVPPSNLMDRATELREELDALKAAMEAALDRVGRAVADAQAYEDAQQAVSEAQTALEAAAETRETWMDATREVVFEYRGLPLDVRQKALEGGRAAARTAIAELDKQCGEPAQDEEGGGEEE